jgi:hypothetical protein
MTAVQQVRGFVKDGMAVALAIFKTAHDYGMSTQQLSKLYRGGRETGTQLPPFLRPAPADAWWEK